MATDEPVIREYGRGAELLLARKYLGLERREMALALQVPERTLQNWEEGRDRVISTIWADVEKLYERFDGEVEQLLERAEAGETIVKVWRGRTAAQPFPGWWQRVVSEAARENRAITPKFPEDLEQEKPR